VNQVTFFALKQKPIIGTKCSSKRKNTIIGAGSVVTRDIPDGVVAWGSPCKIKN
jgi:hypothetical protein